MRIFGNDFIKHPGWMPETPGDNSSGGYSL
jgi:hypothetical protein